jgi:phage antirepressor YoqD-like protein/predicted transcriptional regulator
MQNTPLIVNNNLTMSSREIAELCEARHNDVVATINRLFEKGLLRSSRKTRQEATGGRPVDVYDLTERDSYLVVAGYSDEVRARIIDRWQELEQQAQFSIPKTFAQALMLAANQAEQIEQQHAVIEQQRPAVEFVDHYVSSTGNRGFREVCKLLNANESEFREFLIENGIMYRLGGALTPMAQHMNTGRFVVKAGASDGGHAFNQAKFTPKGIQWVAGMWIARKVAA